MKKIIFLTVVLLTLKVYSNEWDCPVENPNTPIGPIGPANLQVIVVYIDFPDGRIQPGNVVPTEAYQLNQVQNLDAVLNMGYVADPHQGPLVYNALARKYTYDDCWNRFFADGTYIGTAHPDWESHGIYGYPPTGDTARAWGSLKDYYWEVSYHNLNIVAAVTHPNETGIYRTGILNRIADANGVKHVIPIMMPNAKTSYGTPVSWNTIHAHAWAKILSAFPNEIDIDMNNFTGKVIFIAAGGNDGDGGVGGGNSCIMREKFALNNFFDKKYCVINGIAISCHEFGHMLGWGHTPLAYYCIMGPGKTYQNCPSHPAMPYKLQMGWVNPNNIRKVRTSQDIVNLPPSEYSGDCAVLTLYGKPGYNNEYLGHSEYYVIENRRMLDDPVIKFDKRFVWNNAFKPPGFTGGCLITHYSVYNNFPLNGGTNFRIISADVLRPPELWSDEGHSRDFFGVQVIGNPSFFGNLSETRTKSSFELNTGLTLTNINQPDGTNNISFQTNYTLGPQPDYDFVLYGQNNLPEPITINGNVLISISTGNAKHLQILPGTDVDIITLGGNLEIANGSIEAEGNIIQPITFGGVGYGQYIISYNLLLLKDRTSLGSVDQTIFRYCNFQNFLSVIPITLSNSIIQPTNPEIIIENNSFPVGKMILILAGNQTFGAYNIINSIKDNNCDFTVRANSLNATIINGQIKIPGNNYLKFEQNGNICKYNLTENSLIEVAGSIYAEGSPGSRIEFNKVFGGGFWNGIYVNEGSANIRYCDFKNSNYCISVSSPLNTLLDGCNFENNMYQDIGITNFYGGTAIDITNNTFDGSRINYNLGLRNGIYVNVINNSFTNVNPVGVFIDNVSEPGITENNVAGAGTGIQGILSYSSGGIYTCNDIQSCSNALLLNNSSPYIYNNYIHDNVKGLFLTNGSSPIMAPSSTPGGTLLNAGFNVINNCSEEEIYCDNNPWVPLSLPLIQNGKNIIYDLINPGCIVNINQSAAILNAQDNYWGEPPHPLTEDFCPQGMIDYSNWLTVIPPPPTNCNASLLSGGSSNQSQEMLLLSSANIDYYNGNYQSAIIKYKNYITLVNNPSKSYLPIARIHYATSVSNRDFIALESYYTSLGQQFSSDTNFSHKSFSFSTASDVEQPSYSEAIGEYQQVISTSQNPVEVHYAYIDKMRAVRLMLDSLLRGMSGGNGPQGGSQSSGLNEVEKMISEFLNHKFHVLNARINDFKFASKRGDKFSPQKLNNDNKDEKSIGKNTDNLSREITTLENIKTMKQSLKLERIDLRNMTKHEITQLIDNAISYKIIEYTLLNHTSYSEIPQISEQRKIKINALPKHFELYQNYPNPFNPQTTIKYDIPKDNFVLIKIYDILGRELFKLDEFKKAGSYEVNFDGSNYASGIYLYRIESGIFIDSKKMVLIK